MVRDKWKPPETDAEWKAKHEKFYQAEAKADKVVNAYFTNGFNKTRAFLKVFPKTGRKHATQEATKYFNYKSVFKKVCEKRTRMMEKFEVTEDRIVQELACVAFFDIRNLLDDDGNLIPISEIPEETRRAMGGLDVEELYRGAGEARLKIGSMKRVKLLSKEKALELLGKHMGMFKDRVVHSGQIEASVKVQKGELDDRLQQLAEDDLGDALK